MTTHMKAIKDLVPRAFTGQRSCRHLLSPRQHSRFLTAGVHHKPSCFRNSLGVVSQSKQLLLGAISKLQLLGASQGLTLHAGLCKG